MKFTGFFVCAFLFVSNCFAQLEKPATPSKAELAAVKAKAAKGNTESLSLLGQYHYYGLGVVKNYPTALKWLNKAAAKNDVPAMLLLGEMYEQGMGVPRDLKKSLDWTKKAALKGSSDAAYELAEMYEKGNGVPKDMTESVKWYTIAADKGDVDAMISLGFCYMEGDGVPVDRKAGYDWFVKAAEKGEPEAMRYLGDYYAQADMGNDCNKAISWYMKAADAGDSISVKPVGVAVMKDECATVDKYEVAQWMKKHADLNNPEACFYMGGFYVMGIGVKKNAGKGMEMLIRDRELAEYTGAERNFSTNNLFTLYNSGDLNADQQQRLLKWFEGRARAENDGEMMAVLANIYINKEKAGAADNRAALDWATKSADMGNPNGCFWLGYIYYKGLGDIKKNDGRAFLWMLKSAQKGDKDAMKIVSELYEYGIGTDRNSKKAAEWAAKSKAKEI